jgi:O-antigen/teichoic acid export membrane protein
MAYASVAVVAIGAISPFVFVFVFGAKWQAAGIYAGWLSLRGAAQAVVSPISSIAVLRQRQGLQLAVEGVKCIAAALSLYVPYWLGYSATVAVIAYSISASLLYVLSYMLYRSLCRSAVPSKTPPRYCPDAVVQTRAAAAP